MEVDLACEIRLLFFSRRRRFLKRVLELYVEQLCKLTWSHGQGHVMQLLRECIGDVRVQRKDGRNQGEQKGSRVRHPGFECVLPQSE